MKFSSTTACQLDETMVDVHDTTGEHRFLLKRLSRDYLENRIYELEMEDYETGNKKTSAQQLSELLQTTLSWTTDKTIPIFLCEAATCAWAIRKRPFPWSPRVPREKEMFKFSKLYGDPTYKSEYLGTFTCRKYPVSKLPGAESHLHTTRPSPSVAISSGTADPHSSQPTHHQAPLASVGDITEPRMNLGKKRISDSRSKLEDGYSRREG